MVGGEERVDISTRGRCLCKPIPRIELMAQVKDVALLVSYRTVGVTSQRRYDLLKEHS
jgi:hypothetical protein